MATFALPGRPEFAVADGRGHIYDNLEDKNEVALINTRTLRVEPLWPLGTGTGPSGLAMDERNRRLFSVCDNQKMMVMARGELLDRLGWNECDNQKMVVMDADNGRVLATLPIGNGPDACAFDPATHLIFCPNGEDGTLTVVREEGPMFLTRVAKVVASSTCSATSC